MNFQEGLEALAIEMGDEVERLQNIIGLLSSLATSDKSSVVAAINELVGSVGPHTHVIDDVTGLQAVVDAVALNTAKQTNATHTGDVTGDVILGIASSAISGKTQVTPEGGDFVLLWDSSDPGTLKKADVADLGGGGGGGEHLGYEEIAIVNGDFETGDATGWDVVTGTIYIEAWQSHTSYNAMPFMTTARFGTYLFDGGNSGGPGS